MKAACRIFRLMSWDCKQDWGAEYDFTAEKRLEMEKPCDTE